MNLLKVPHRITIVATFGTSDDAGGAVAVERERSGVDEWANEHKAHFSDASSTDRPRPARASPKSGRGSYYTLDESLTTCPTDIVAAISFGNTAGGGGTHVRNTSLSGGYR